MTRSQVQYCLRDEVLYEQGELSNRIFIPLSGLYLLNRTEKKGQKSALIVDSTKLIGEESYYSKELAKLESAVTKAEGSVLVLPLPTLRLI